MEGILPDMEVRKSPGAKVPHAEFFPPPPTPRGPSLWRARLAADRAELVRFWPVVQNMVVQELHVRYQRSILGFFWTLLNPLLMLATLSVVFSQLVGTPDERYPLFLLAGMVPWGLLSVSLNDSAQCIIANEGLIRKIYVPKLVFPLSRVLIALVTFVFSLGAMFLLLLPLGARPSWSMLALPVIIGLFAIFTLGLSLIVATANTFFRDCGHLISVFLQAWYFVTPILYPASRFPEGRRWLFGLNPAYYFIELFHEVLYSGRWPGWGLWSTAAAIAAVSQGVGYAIFKSHEDKMVFRL
jgi:ABC-2 type transport system permease protein/lipopolysaccharide transport system permease protein